MTTWAPPRCSHGRIILGCPDDQCPEQNAYLAEQAEVLSAFTEHQRETARSMVRNALGLDTPEP